MTMIGMVLLIILLMIYGCKTKTVVEEHTFVKVDSIVQRDTVYRNSYHTTYDTTYVYDSNIKDYRIGSIDTVLNIRVDTVVYINKSYVYHEKTNDNVDSTAVSHLNQQKQTAERTDSVEKTVEEKKSSFCRWAEIILCLIIIAAVFLFGIKFRKWLDNHPNL